VEYLCNIVYRYRDLLNDNNNHSNVFVLSSCPGLLCTVQHLLTHDIMTFPEIKGIKALPVLSLHLITIMDSSRKQARALCEASVLSTVQSSTVSLLSVQRRCAGKGTPSALVRTPGHGGGSEGPWKTCRASSSSRSAS